MYLKFFVFGTETTQSIVFYVAKYSCKFETESINSVMKDAIREAQNSSNENMRKRLFKFSIKIFNEREVFACECVYCLCHLPLKGSSRDTVFVNTSGPSERFRMQKLRIFKLVDNSHIQIFFTILVTELIIFMLYNC